MKELFANADIGTFGLILFFALFCIVVGWTLRPGAKNKYKQHGEIPFREDQKDD
jgi:cbb3-type cytochrome oxidase subunit 3